MAAGRAAAAAAVPARALATALTADLASRAVVGGVGLLASATTMVPVPRCQAASAPRSATRAVSCGAGSGVPAWRPRCRAFGGGGVGAAVPRRRPPRVEGVPIGAAAGSPACSVPPTRAASVSVRAAAASPCDAADQTAAGRCVAAAELAAKLMPPSHRDGMAVAMVSSTGGRRSRRATSTAGLRGPWHADQRGVTTPAAGLAVGVGLAALVAAGRRNDSYAGKVHTGRGG